MTASTKTTEATTDNLGFPHQIGMAPDDTPRTIKARPDTTKKAAPEHPEREAQRKAAAKAATAKATPKKKAAAKKARARKS